MKISANIVCVCVHACLSNKTMGVNYIYVVHRCSMHIRLSCQRELSSRQPDSTRSHNTPHPKSCDKPHPKLSNTAHSNPTRSHDTPNLHQITRQHINPTGSCDTTHSNIVFQGHCVTCVTNVNYKLLPLRTLARGFGHPSGMGSVKVPCPTPYATTKKLSPLYGLSPVNSSHSTTA